MHTIKLMGRTRGISLVCFLLFAFFTLLTPANALSLEIGISKAKATRAMISKGYTQIEIFKAGFKTIQARACQNGTRYKVKIDSRYRIKNTQNLGPCRRTIPIERIEENLEKQGYTRIVMENQNGNFVAIACQGEQRVRLVFSQQGRLLKSRNIGICERIYQPNDIRQVLRDQGYDRIKFTDRQLPWYVAEACLNNRRFELLLTRFGEIRKKTRIGRCDPPVDPRNLVNLLRDKGYDRIEIVDDQLPVYQAEACFNNERFDLQMNRFGKITGRTQTGQCRANMTDKEIVAVLKEEGFTRILVNRKSNGQFDVSACFDGYQKFATLSRFGELVSERDGGKCKSRSVSEIFTGLENRNFDDLKFYAEGCRNGKRFQFTYNRDGDRIGRKRLGSC
ncbi:MAG: hypothetical protein AAF423_04620 [Pseudomonadota bacterium]